jgi:hypothetical protein
MELRLEDLVRPPRAEPLVVEDVRPIARDDLAGLTEARGSEAPPIKKLRYKHHSLARALADGLSEREAGLVAGYTLSRVSILKNDPAFKDLITFYQGQHRDYRDIVQEKNSQVTLAALEELDTRLSSKEQRKKIGTSLLSDIATRGLDRMGYGPQTRQNVTVDLNFATRLEGARKRIGQEPEGQRRPDTLDADFEVVK